MIQIIFGEKGTGKTKRILDLANRAAQEAKGSIVFIDNDDSYMFDLNLSVRFINALEYGIAGPKAFYGFLCGISASDHDLEYIYVDGFLNLVKHDLSTLEELFNQLIKDGADFLKKSIDIKTRNVTDPIEKIKRIIIIQRQRKI